VKLGMAFRDIAEKEKISVTPTEISEQLDMLNVQVRYSRATVDRFESLCVSTYSRYWRVLRGFLFLALYCSAVQ
jgi:hypothetical protein